MKLVLVRAVDIDEALSQRLEAWLSQVFDEPVDDYIGAVPGWRLLALEGDLPVGHVDITERTVLVDGQPLQVGGIGGVATLEGWRRRGIATAALQCAADFLGDELAVPFGLLFCDPALVPFYAKLGWQEIPGPLVYDQPDPCEPGLEQAVADRPVHKVLLDGAAMVLPCLEQNWPAGLVDLCGFPW